MSPPAAYGLWSLVIINSLVFLIFAFSFTRPRTTRDWRSLGGFAAFIVPLFTEMYGVPLTIYLFWGWLAGRFEGLDLLTHDAGHLWQTLLGWKGDPHLNPIHLPPRRLAGRRRHLRSTRPGRCSTSTFRAARRPSGAGSWTPGAGAPMTSWSPGTRSR